MANGTVSKANDVKVFAGFALMNVFLGCTGAFASMLYRDSVNPGPEFDAWLWVIAFPSRVADHFRCEFLSNILLGMNPLIYGAMGWFAWKMFCLVRPKPPEVESPPLHNE
jgi:hypothetical protein